jgi:type IV pilus assembly protein PilA
MFSAWFVPGSRHLARSVQLEAAKWVDQQTATEEGSQMMKKIRGSKGFTLVELMIVVAIIGILAAIAIPNFLNFRLKAKTSEAKSNLGAIRSTEVAYFAEWNIYIDNQALVPNDRTAAGTRAQKAAWTTTSKFSILGFAPEGNVYYSYSLDDTAEASAFTANAVGDLDDDGVLSTYSVNESGSDISKSGGPF